MVFFFLMYPLDNNLWASKDIILGSFPISRRLNSLTKILVLEKMEGGVMSPQGEAPELH